MIEVIQTDITALDVDVIVNAANSSLLGGGGVDGAIHQAAGPELLAFNKRLNGCGTGEAKLSPGFNLPANWIIHTVGPVWKGGEQKEAELLRSCYVNCFKLALSIHLDEIAFPAISTGVYGFPLESATQIAVTAMQEYENNFKRIIACCFQEKDRLLYEAMLQEC